MLGGVFLVIGVLVELSNKNIDKIFDYKVPSYLENKIKIGIRVEVPFGKQKLEGFVLDIRESYDSSIVLRDILNVVSDEVVLNSELIELGKWLKEKTLATLISCYQVMLPKALKAKAGNVINKKYDTCYRLNDVDLSKYKLSEKMRNIIELFDNK